MPTEETLQTWIAMAKAASEKAYAPYSHYAVGALLVAQSGKTYTGCNVENAAYPSGLCAERTALVKAVSEGERQFAHLVVYAQNALPYPCGACRQMLSEFAPQLPVTVTDGSHIRTVTLDALMPYPFVTFSA